MTSDDRRLASALRDVSNCEVRIGDLLDQVEDLRRRNADLLKDYMRLTSDRTNLILQTLHRSSTETDRHLRELAALVASMASNRWPNKPVDLSAFVLESDRISRIAAGEVVEALEHKSHALDGSGMTTVRMATSMERDQQGRNVIRATDKQVHGVHSIILDFSRVAFDCVRGVQVVCKSEGVPTLRVRVRQIGKTDRLSQSVNLDLRTGEVGNFLPKSFLLPRTAVCEALDDGWWSVTLQLPAGPGISSASTDVELLSVTDFSSGSSQHGGDQGASFLIREVALIVATGVAENSVKASPGSSAEKAQTLPSAGAMRDEVARTPRADAIRTAYLASGAYSRVAAMKNRHLGGRAVIIGNGPSINKQDLTKLRNETTFVTNWFVNHPDFKKIKPNYYCVSSHEMFGGWKSANPQINVDWYAKMLDLAPDTHRFFSYRFRDYIRENKIFSDSLCDYLLFERTKRLVDEANDFNLDLSRPMDDGYTGVITFAIPLAVHMGCREIYLVGCDCDYGITEGSDEKKYFYDYSQHKSTTTKVNSLQRIWADGGPVFKAYEIVKSRLELEGVEVYNATEGGKLEVFERKSFDSVFNQVKERES